MTSVRTLDVQTYQQHSIHGSNRIWTETNCYVDVALELISALGFEPIAALPFSLSISFEGDQWTFFKFPHYDLFQLYGIEIQELNPWENLPQHIETQLEQGRPVLVELDSFFLPDTSGTTYGTEHVKSTVAINMIDLTNRKMGYFHGQSYFELEGDDFDSIFQTKGLVHERMLPPYIELVKLHNTAVTQSELVKRSIEALKRQIPLIPKENPFEKFSVALADQLNKITNSDIEYFHQYSFATLRQFGACYELAATYLEWLQNNIAVDFSQSISNFLEISQSAKTLQFQLARAVARNKAIDLSLLDHLAAIWDTAIKDVKVKVREL